MDMGYVRTHKRSKLVAEMAAAVTLALGLVSIGSAQAAVTVGADNLSQTLGVSCSSSASEPCSFVTLTQSNGVAETGSPINGVLVSARVRTTGTANTVAVRVLRQNLMVADTYLNLGPEISIPVDADGTATGHVTEALNLHHPIAAGDRIGVGYTQPAGVFQIGANDAPSMAACGFRQGPGNDHPVATERTYTLAGCGLEVLVQGTVEPDADGDNFGDETQDLCPTSAATQGACPRAATPTAPAPTVAKKKCKKKKRRGASAAKKCKKRKK